MNKLIIFDLDGVLIDSKEIHFNALNDALGMVSEKYVISLDEHHNIYDGLPTNTKLQLLTKNKNLPKELYDNIWKNKQELTIKYLDCLQRDDEMISYLRLIKSNNIKTALCSNSIKITINHILEKFEIKQFFDEIYSNEDIKTPKPFPEIYWRAMIDAKAYPKDTVIFEDSDVGKLGARNSGGYLIPIENRKTFSVEKINEAIKYLS